MRSINRVQEIPLEGGMCDLLWSDPEEDVTGWHVSSRGCRYIFGGDVVTKVGERRGYEIVQQREQSESGVSVASDGDGGIQVDVQQPVGGCVVCAELLLPVWKLGVDHGSGRVSANNVEGV